MPMDQRWVWGGIAVGGAGIAIWMYRRNKKEQAAAASAQYAYGYGYGSYGYGQLSYEPYGYGFGPQGLGAYGGSGMYGYGYYGAGTVPTQVPTQAQTNAQWSEAAISALAGAGYDTQNALGALGIYLTGGNLTGEQLTIVQAAIAAEGYPPVPGPNNFPPQWHTGGTPGGGQGGTTPANAAGAISNLRVTATGKTTATIRWNATTGATQGYRYVVTQMNGKVVKSANTRSTSVNLTGLHAGWTYNFGIQALPGGPGNNLHFTTKR